jgi:hypothetical protein
LSRLLACEDHPHHLWIPLMSFLKNYSQNGAAQALVVLGLFTVAAEVVRTRTTKKRPYRDYGVGGMNEEEDMMLGRASDMDFDESTMGWGQAPMAQSQRSMAQSQRSMMQGQRPMAQAQGQRYKTWAGWDDLAASQGEMGDGHPSPLDLMDEMDEMDEMGSMPSAQVMVQQQFRETMPPAHRGVAGGYMNRAPSPWNEYVATEVPKLMERGMSAPQAMKEASKTFHRAERARMGLPPSSKAPPRSNAPQISRADLEKARLKSKAAKLDIKKRS